MPALCHAGSRTLTTLWALALGAGLSSAWILKADPAPPGLSTPATVVQVAGTVEFAPAGGNAWKAAIAGSILQGGDRLRTGADSRATVRLSDLSVIRINQLSVLEIRAPAAASRRGFRLERGAIYFLNREKPGDIELETPLATGAIRGTEFLLAVDAVNGTTTLALFEGAVELATASGPMPVPAGKQAVIRPGAAPSISATLPLTSLIQWAFYYPGVLNPDDLPFTAKENAKLELSLAAYRAGDLLKALVGAPVDLAESSDASRIYYAALKLGVGQVADSQNLLAGCSTELPGAAAVRALVASVTGQPWTARPGMKTSSEWLAQSYHLQRQSRLEEALAAARTAVSTAPAFGFGWARVAELEFGFEHREAAREALRRAHEYGPRNAYAIALAGFVDLDAQSPRSALEWFDRALAIDGSIGMAWLGRGLAQEQLGKRKDGRTDFQMAASLEPQRALFRSYLGKGWSEAGRDGLANKELLLAQQLDPADPTAWLYSALHKHQARRLNEAARDLEHAIALNDNRSVFRSRLLLDRDRAIRQADLAAIYDEVGLSVVGERAAARAVQDDYASFSGHLFLGRSLQAREDPAHFDLRLETPRQSELLVANLLAPPGGANLSQVLSQADHLHYFDARPVGFSSYTEYRSRGDWVQEASVYGHVDGVSYAVDGEYASLHGQRANNDLEFCGYSAQVKQFLTPDDSLYAQVGYARTESGDVAQHYDPASASRAFNATDVQEPYVYLGYHHEWSPGVHTLFLAARVPDRLSVTNPNVGPLFIHLSGGKPFTVERDPFFAGDFHGDVTIYSAELQQVFESPHHAFVFGMRYQSGRVENDALLTRGLSGTITDQTVSEDLERAAGYGYYYWRPVERVRLTAGLSYDALSFPRNADSPPLRAGTDSRSQVSPKVGLTIDLWEGGHFRGAWTRSLGGLYFDDSIRLEPAQVAGFISSYRSLIPESVAGVVPGAAFEVAGAGFDQKFASDTYIGISAERLTSESSRDVGAFTNGTFLPLPDSPTSTRQHVNFEERTLSAYVNQLIGRRWAAGALYQYTEGELNTRFHLPRGISNLGGIEQDEQATLNHARLFLVFNHECGVFAQWSSDWYGQNNGGYIPARPGADFWQHNAFVGYRFPRRHAEIRVGVLNLTDHDYRLNPLNPHEDLSRHRTFFTSLRLNF